MLHLQTESRMYLCILLRTTPINNFCTKIRSNVSAQVRSKIYILSRDHRFAFYDRQPQFILLHNRCGRYCDKEKWIKISKMIISLMRFDLQKVFGDSMEDNNATKLFQISLILPGVNEYQFVNFLSAHLYIFYFFWFIKERLLLYYQ